MTDEKKLDNYKNQKEYDIQQNSRMAASMIFRASVLWHSLRHGMNNGRFPVFLWMGIDIVLGIDQLHLPEGSGTSSLLTGATNGGNDAARHVFIPDFAGWIKGTDVPWGAVAR